MSASTPGTAGRSDQMIGDDAIRALADADNIDAGEILVQVSDGKVTLSGDVPERAMKPLAERIVAALPGVAGVRNLINVDDGSASFGRPGEAVRGADHQGGPGSTAELDLDEDG